MTLQRLRRARRAIPTGPPRLSRTRPLKYATVESGSFRGRILPQRTSWSGQAVVGSRSGMLVPSPASWGGRRVVPRERDLERRGRACRASGGRRFIAQEIASQFRCPLRVSLRKAPLGGPVTQFSESMARMMQLGRAFRARRPALGGSCPLEPARTLVRLAASADVHTPRHLHVRHQEGAVLTVPQSPETRRATRCRLRDVRLDDCGSRPQ